MDYNVLLNCFGLLFLTISSNYSDKLLSCEMQETYTNNVWIKHLLTYLLLVFFIVAIDKKAYEDAARKQWMLPRILLISFVVYLMFLVVTKMQAMYALSILFLIVVYMLLDIEKAGKQDKAEENHDTIIRLQMIQNGIIKAIIFIAAYGFITYFLKQRREHAEDFKYSTFLVGTRTCARFQGK